MISIRLDGRLGNQMFQYATLRAVSQRTGYDFFIPRIGHELVADSTEGHHLSRYFNLDLGTNDLRFEYFYNESPVHQNYKPSIFNIRDFTLLHGFFQTEKYFLDIEDEVNNWFRVDINGEISNFFQKYDINETCFIHIRGSDYKHHMHWMLNVNYYTSAIHKMKEMKPNLKFLVITDDVELSKKMLPNLEAQKNDMMHDFRIIFFSKYSIISNSTFAWWAAWLNSKEKIVLAPSFWLNHNKPELNYYPQDIKSSKFIYV